MVRRIGMIVAITLLSLMAVFVVSFKVLERDSRLNLVPASLQVSKIIFGNEESWGFGPGGNETRVIVYELPIDVAEDIQRMGLDFFNQILPNAQRSGNWQGRHQKWKETPILSPAWLEQWDNSPSDRATTSSAKIENYLYRYGFGIYLEPSLSHEINSAISKSGSFFSASRTAIIIVMPEARLVAYTYSG